MPYPILLDLTGRDVLVVGGGNVAARKIRGLVAAGANVRCVAPEIVAAVRELVDAEEIFWEERHFRTTDIRRATLVFAATDSDEVNHRILKTSRRRAILASCVTDQEDDFILPAVSSRDNFGIAVWTGVPALTRRLRDECAATIDPRWERAATLMRAWRAKLKETVDDPAERRELLRRAAAGAPGAFDDDESGAAFLNSLLHAADG